LAVRDDMAQAGPGSAEPG